MAKILKDKRTKEVKFVWADDAKIKIKKDGLGKSVIHIENYPPARVVGNTTYLGGTYICDQDFVENMDEVDDVVDVPADIKEKKYKIDHITKEFTEITEAM